MNKHELHELEDIPRDLKSFQSFIVFIFLNGKHVIRHDHLMLELKA